MAAQLPDVIIINGEKMNLYSNPLEEFWISRKKERPAFCTSSICKRGYVATWEITNDQLFLKDIDGNYETQSLLLAKQKLKYSIQVLFSKPSDKGVKAEWYSGKLRIPGGNMTMYEHNNYDSRFEKETIITVEYGVVTKTVTLDYTQQTLTLIN